MKYIYLLSIVFLINAAAKAQTTSVVYFNTNQYSLSKPAMQTLDSIVKEIKSEKIYDIIFSGYTDNTGEDNLNQTLSEQRANAVADYVKSKNILSENFIIKGYGKTMPVLNNNTEAGRKRNRRVEIFVNLNPPTPAQAAPFPALPPKIKMEPAAALTENTSAKELEIGQVLTLPNLNFIGGTAVLLPEAKPALETLLKIMKEIPTLEIEIGGHVCCADDMPLSTKRAVAVEKYLTENGIDDLRLHPKGYSRNKPIVPDDRDEKNAKLNRRVEITILRK